MSSKRKEIDRLGLEEGFLDLLRWEIPKEVDERIKGCRLQSMLDIGCRDGFALLLAYYHLGIGHLEGVERVSEEQVTNEALTFMVKHGVQPQEKSLRGYWFAVNSANNKPNPRLQTMEDYKALMKITYGCDALDYKPLLDKYDLIVMSHVLHYMTIDEIHGALKRVERCMHDNTKVYISVKDRFSESPVTAKELLKACRDFIAMHPSIQEYQGVMFPKDGRGYTFTNL